MKMRKSVQAVVLAGKGGALLTFKKHPHKSFWELPGGGVKEGEKESDAILRELGEELGTRSFRILKELDLVHEYEWPEGVKRLRGFDGQKKKMFIVEFYGKKEEIKIDKRELDGYGIFGFKEAKEKLDFESAKKVFEAALKELGS